jgi:hypothetical protein
MPRPFDDRLAVPILLGSTLTLALVVILVTVVWKRMQRLTSGRSPFPAVAPSLKRSSPSAQTRRAYHEAYVQAQLTQEQHGPPSLTDITNATDYLQSQILVPGHEFHARHPIADSFLRGVTMEILQRPDATKEAAIRTLFHACGGLKLANIFDQVTHALHHNTQPNWFHRLGPNLVYRLKKALDNIEGLFLSEFQGNLHAGTHADLTADASAILGPQRLRDIVSAAVEVMELFGLRPQLATVGSDVLLSYEGGIGELRWYGYDPTRAHDQPSDALSLMEPAQVARVWANSSLEAKCRYCFIYEPQKFAGIVATVAVSLIGAISWPAIERYMGQASGDPAGGQ